MNFSGCPSFKNLIKWLQKDTKGDTEKENKVPLEYNRVKLTSATAKLWFDKAVEINKNFIIEQVQLK